MTGFVGMLHLDGGPADRALLESLTDLLAFRGPDAQRVWAQGPAGLGSASFSTRHEDTGAPPPAQLGGSLWITGDVRLDDRESLVAKLETRGRRDLGRASDAMLVLHAYRVWRRQSIEHLFGSFAFALWDSDSGELFCARDRLGIKPFYYALAGRTLVFSNTLDCLRAHPEVSSELNEQAIADFLVMGVNQEPQTTSFRAVRRLPPAHFLVASCRDPALSLQRYWRLSPVETLRYRRRSDYVEQFRELLHRAVVDRLRTRRVGVLMSGGLDSTSVAVTAHEVLSAAAAPFDMEALTFVYPRLMEDKEDQYAGLVAESKGFRIRRFEADDYELYEKGFQSRYRPPEPTDAPLASSFFEQFPPERDYPRVILTGQGGDPALLPSADYFFRLARGFRCWQMLKDVTHYALRYRQRPPFYLRQHLRQRLSPAASTKAVQLPPWLSCELSSRLSLNRRWRDRSLDPRPYAGCAREEAHENLSVPFWASLFECYDAGATGFLTELRHPFLDLRLMRFLLGLPSVPWCVDKQIVRESMRGRLPEPVRRRRKTPLGGFPEYEKIRRCSMSTMDALAATPGLERFVERERFLRMAHRPERLRPSEYTLITRPLSLAVWLRQIETPRASVPARPPARASAPFHEGVQP